MGEVYLAEDSRLDRKVALKILPQHLSDRAELRERFEREARAVSSLNHPHICTLHDIGEKDGIHYLVMEHLVGETLEARLAKGALPLEQTLEYAIQIADALDKAHRQGVVHRDLKPGNIMLVKSGAKLLDFGLAKLQAADTPTNLSALPTEQANLTAEGTILGTLQYMAPEQLEAKEADSRTDIFAFGAVVYEMATGKKAFEGKSQASLIAAIMEKDPPAMAELQPMTPELLDWVVKRCLAKEPDERVQSATDLMAELKWVSDQTPELGADHRQEHPYTWKSVLPWGVAVVAVLLGIALGWNTTSPTSSPLIRLEIAPRDADFISDRRFADLVIPPDGTHVMYHGAGEQLYLRSLDNLVARSIPGTEGAERDFFFSPDGGWVAFVVERQLKKVSLQGGAPITLCEARIQEGGSWSSQGLIYFAAGTSLYRVSENGGEPEMVASADPDKGEVEYQHPQVLPGGRAVLFAIYRGAVEYQVAVLSLETGVHEVLIEDGRNPRFVSTGHLIYELPGTGTLMAIQFDASSLQVAGSPIPVLEGVRTALEQGSADYGISSDGTLVYIPGQPARMRSSLVWVDKDGSESLLTPETNSYGNPRLSPDGKRLAVGIVDDEGLFNILVYDLETSSFSRLTFEGANSSPAWSPDGQWISFRSDRSGKPHSHYRKRADGSGAPELLISHESRVLGATWSPDGTTLLFNTIGDPGSPSNIYEFNLGSEGKPQPLLASPAGEHSAEFSPDGKWVAYVSGESGRDEVYVQTYPQGGGKWPISIGGGEEPLWSPARKELFYRNGNRMMAVDFKTTPTFSSGTPRLLFETPYNMARLATANYEISRDGRRFLMIKGETQERTRITVVLNWFEELKRLVPTDN